VNKLRRRKQKARASDRRRARAARVLRMNRMVVREREREGARQNMTAWDEMYERQAARYDGTGRDWR